jgi:hypothetical protein
MLDENKLARVGRNAYCVGGEDTCVYSHLYSDRAVEIATLIIDSYSYLDFRIFELVQLNEFLNHQIAHNTVFVSVESNLGDFVFDLLKEQYPGKVLIHPNNAIYQQYWVEDMIVILKLPTESPRGRRETWHTCIEKMIVDIFCDKLLCSVYPSEEMVSVMENIFSKYVVDESKLFRYARRRGADKKLISFIEEETRVKLRLEHR